MADITVAETSGFCFGVRRAVDLALETARHGICYTVGPIVHSRAVIQYLRDHGADCTDDWRQVRDKTLIIRSHGLPKREWEAIVSRGSPTVDATCPCVSRIHRLAEDVAAENRKLIIAGSLRHPEVIGIAGWSDDSVVIETDADTEALIAATDRLLPAAMVAQTTLSPVFWEKCV
jgi:4-hydroxy-3-methylbut-2-enyl diphosphate reductase